MAAVIYSKEPAIVYERSKYRPVWRVLVNDRFVCGDCSKDEARKIASSIAVALRALNQ